MKKFYWLLLPLVLLASCATPKPAQYIAYFDYATIGRQYNVQFRENDNVSFDYETLGSFYILETSGYTVTKVEQIQEQPVRRDASADDIYGGSNHSVKRTQKKYQSATAQSVLELAAQTAVNYGGDYILKINIRPTIANGEPSFEATGLVVKRIE